MDILDRDHYWALPRHRLEPPANGLKEELALANGVEPTASPRTWARYAQQFAEQPQRFRCNCGIRRDRGQFLKLNLWRIRGIEHGGPLQMRDERKEHALPVSRRALVAPHYRCFRSKSRQQLKLEARLADAGLPDNDDDLPVSRLCALPLLQQQLHLTLATHQRSNRAESLEATRGCTGADNPPGLHRAGEALQIVRSEILVVEKAAHQPLRFVGDNDLVGTGQTL